jgi:hypothetical protein
MAELFPSLLAWFWRICRRYPSPTFWEMPTNAHTNTNTNNNFGVAFHKRKIAFIKGSLCYEIDRL